ncbi:MAG TPA: glycosyltransferase family 2 protein [Verrucomicrobiae bacterium]
MQTSPPVVSIGIVAWNEEEAIAAALQSLFRQSLFDEFDQRGGRIEIICVANGCTDGTATIATRIFEEQARTHLSKDSFSCRVVELRERGKCNAWNAFVHRLSAREAECLFLMDADIVIPMRDTLWNMYRTLAQDAEANVAVDRPLKDISLKVGKSLWERISLAASELTQAGDAQLTGQLYCIRAAVARNIHLPRDLLVEDGFIQSIVCTDYLTRERWPRRVVRATNASHVYEAYTSLRDILRNQKRQMIGQTIVHLLVDDHLKRLPLPERLDLAETLRRRDNSDPAWLKRLIADHLHRTRYFWRLFPGILSFRFKRLSKIQGVKKLLCLPAALGGFFVTLVACWMARRSVVRGFTDYWPDTKSPALKDVAADTTASAYRSGTTATATPGAH